jgi:hypothetical protein
MPFSWRVSSNGYLWTGPPDRRVLKGLPGSCGFRDYAPLQDYTGLFLTFSATEPTEEGMLRFANQFGPLGLGRMGVRGEVESEELFSVWAEQVRTIREAVQHWEQTRLGSSDNDKRETLHATINDHLQKTGMAHLFGSSLLGGGGRLVQQVNLALSRLALSPPPLLELVSGAEAGKVSLEVHPSSLLYALWFLFARAVVKNSHFRQCASCSSWFEVSPERRRADAQYCKELCRVRAYKARRKEARRLADSGRSLRDIAQQLGTTVKIAKGWIAGTKS